MALLHLLSQEPGGTHKLGAPAVVDGDIQMKSGIEARAFLGGLECLPLLVREAVLVAQDPDAHVFRVQFVDLGGEKVQDQLHQGVHFLPRPGPVLGGEGVQGEGMDAQIIRVPDDAAKSLCALAVALGHTQAVLLGPSSVAVHDDGHVVRQALEIVCVLLLEVAFPEPDVSEPLNRVFHTFSLLKGKRSGKQKLYIAI